MKLLSTIFEKGVSDKTTQQLPRNYHHRTATRAVVLDADRSVALLHVSKFGYHKLPGGGVEENENLIAALKREVREEIGCQIDVIGEVGRIDEYWDQEKTFQQSSCYVTHVVGRKLKPQFSGGEITEGFKVRWVESIEKALIVLQHDTPQNYDGRMIQPRDIEFLKAANKLI